jgi:hypothetical protein
MKNHDDIRRMLPALAGNDLSAVEQALMEQHLTDCPACRAELAQLRAVLQAMRTAPEVEPPDWLAGRVMARVREESPQRRSWLARLFLPLHLKLPLEAFALVIICVTAWYITQDQNRSQQVLQESPAKMTPSSESSKDAASPTAPVVSVAPKAESRPLMQAARPELQGPSAPIVVAPQQVGTDRADRMERSKSASETVPIIPRREPLAGAPAAPLTERKMGTKHKAETGDNRLDVAGSGLLRLRLVVDDRTGVAEKIRDSVQQSGGFLRDNRSGSALVRIEASRLPDLLEHLVRLGRVVEYPGDQAPREGWIELQVFW